MKLFVRPPEMAMEDKSVMIINVWRWIGAIGIMAVGVVLAALVWRYCSWGDFDACDEVGLLMVWLMVVLIAALNYGMG